MMQTRSKLKPGQKGTIKLVELCSSRLVCVRYRYGEQRHKRLKTLELIVEESSWPSSPIKPHILVAVGVELNEAELQRKVKLAGGKWFPRHKVWHLRYHLAVTRNRSVSNTRSLFSTITNRHLIVDALGMPSN